MYIHPLSLMNPLEKYMINRNDNFKGNIYPLLSIFHHMQLKRS